MDCVICVLNGFLVGEIVFGDKESDSIILNVIKVVFMFFDDFGYYNLIVRSIFVVNIDWILVVLNWYLKVRCVLVINFCYMNKLLILNLFER